MSNKTFEIRSNELYEESLKRCIEICDIHMDTQRGKKVFERCIEVNEKFCKDCIIKVVVTPFSGECVNEDGFLIQNKIIGCNGLESITSSNIMGGYMYAVFVEPMDYSMMTTIQMYYVECWLSAYAEAAWNGMKSLLIEESTEDFTVNKCQGNFFVSESFAPGFGMPMDSIQDLFDLMNLAEYGIKMHHDQMLLPIKSIIGIHLIYL